MKYIEKKDVTEINRSKYAFGLCIYYILSGVLITIINTIIRPNYFWEQWAGIVTIIIIAMSLAALPLYILIKLKASLLILLSSTILEIGFAIVTLIGGVYFELFYLYFSAIICVVAAVYAFQEVNFSRQKAVIIFSSIAGVAIVLISVIVAVIFPVDNGIRYKIQGNHAIVVGASNTKNIVIKDKIRDLNVTEIKTSAFDRNGKAESIIIPRSISKIGRNAFSSMQKLSSITLNPSSIAGKYLGSLWTTKTKIEILENPIYVPDSVKHITISGNVPDYCFYMLESITDIKFIDKVKTIGSYAFALCSNIKEVELPKGLISVKDAAFAYCDKMTKITTPDTLKEIGSASFMQCSSLKSFLIPLSVTSVGDYLFMKAYPLLVVNIEADAATVGKNSNWSKFWAMVPIQFDEKGNPINWEAQVVPTSIHYSFGQSVIE
ncbi:MAG: leucine-rich repeat domain-containing protein [Clostridia bacterium]